ncbi:CRISPR-associated endoribonuclease Cas6 [Rhizohabitans arisaemae]|uniref:CRISPR-associated endoribonuclease Cas6 n=1 Tax=Rhizohabitans arisaemae TaxID=2720610 RepID=UPI0024B096E6|nr:CRISPR-associated endoribonuclease Cas6 [Rhizohabitans arisaemae]
MNVPEMSWADVHGPARGVLYDLLEGQDPALSEELHNSGWAGTPLRPIGISPPLFDGVERRKGVYATGGKGHVWMGSPVPRIAGCLLAGLAGRERIRWGGTWMTLLGVRVGAPSEHSSGVAEFGTLSPVLLKHEGRYLLPDDEPFAERLRHNIRHKADCLGLPNEVEVEVLEQGPRRRFDMPKGWRIGACARVRVGAAPELLDALHAWGLGLSTIEGFGWIR